MTTTTMALTEATELYGCAWDAAYEAVIEIFKVELLDAGFFNNSFCKREAYIEELSKQFGLQFGSGNGELVIDIDQIKAIRTYLRSIAQ